MSEQANDGSSEVRSSLWTFDGIAKWIEGHLWSRSSGSKVTHRPIKMAEVVKAAKVEMLRIRYCIACGTAHHQGSLDTLAWQRIRVWCDGEVDQTRCSDCGRSGVETSNHRCTECRELVGRLASIIQGVADKISIKVVVGTRRTSLFARAQRTREPAPEKEALPRLVPGPAKVTPPPPNPRAKYRKLRGEPPMMPRVNAPPEAMPQIPVFEVLRKFQRQLALYCSGTSSMRSARLSAAWTLISIEAGAYLLESQSGKFVTEMMEVWSTWNTHMRQPERARVRKMIQAIERCLNRQIDLLELASKINTQMNK